MYSQKEKQISDRQIFAKINSIKMKLLNLKQNYFQVLIQNFESKLAIKSGLTEFDLKLTRISLQDIREDSHYNDLIKLKDNDKDLIDFNLKFFDKNYSNKKIYLKSYLNENHFDLILSGKLAKLQCIFFYQHLSIILVSFSKCVCLSALLQTKKNITSPKFDFSIGIY